MATPIPRPGAAVRGSRTGRPVMALFDLLGRPWAMGVVWRLHDGPLTFRALQSACGDMSPSLLSRRLKELTATDLVVHDGTGYRLTVHGQELFALLEPLGNWAAHWAEHGDFHPPDE